MEVSLIRQQCYVNGVWTGSPSLPVTNPATGEILASVPDFGAAETRAAIEAAHAAFTPWSRMLAKERSALLRRWFELIVAHADELALLMTSEQGKPLAEAKGEVLYGASFVEFYAEEAKRIYGETIPSPRAGGRIVVLKQPVGRRGRHHAVEFPAGHDHPQGRARAGGRLHGGVQTGARDAAHRPGAGRTGAPGGHPGGRVQHRHRQRRGHRRRTHLQPAGAHHRLHRLDARSASCSCSRRPAR